MLGDATYGNDVGGVHEDRLASTTSKPESFASSNFGDGYKKGYKTGCVAPSLQTKGPA